MHVRLIACLQQSQRATLTHGAVTELMTQSKKPKSPIVSAADGPSTTQKASKTAKRWDGRNGLGVYIESPETNPENKILEYDDDFVVITDKYPKARYVPMVLDKLRRTSALTTNKCTSSAHPAETGLLQSAPTPSSFHRPSLPRRSTKTRRPSQRTRRVRTPTSIWRLQRFR